jgi:hypothetical protein
MPARCRRKSLISRHGSANANGLTHDVALLVYARNGRGVSRNMFDLLRHDVAPAGEAQSSSERWLAVLILIKSSLVCPADVLAYILLVGI